MNLREIHRSWPNGNRREHYFLDKLGNLTGVYRCWYANSFLHEKITYTTPREGKYEEYYSNGNKSFEYNFTGLRCVGVYQEWYDTGQLALKCEFHDGTLNGLYERFYRSEQIYEQAVYAQGKKHGVFSRWDSDGALTDEALFDSGKLVHINVSIDDKKRNRALPQGEIIVWKPCRVLIYSYHMYRVYAKILVPENAKRWMVMGPDGLEGNIDYGIILQIIDKHGKEYSEATSYGVNPLILSVGSPIQTSTVYNTKELSDENFNIELFPKD